MSVAVREWTPIGTEGFYYFWSKEPDPAAGLPFISWRHPEGYTARAFVVTEDAEDEAILGWLLAQRTADLEASYRTFVKQS